MMAPWWSPRALRQDAHALEQSSAWNAVPPRYSCSARTSMGRSRSSHDDGRRGVELAPHGSGDRGERRPRARAGATCGCPSSPTTIIPARRRNPSASTRSTSSPSIRVRTASSRVVAPDRARLQHAARVGGQALDAHRDDVGEPRGSSAGLLAREAQQLLEVERHDGPRRRQRGGRSGATACATHLRHLAVRQPGEDARRRDVRRPSGVEPRACTWR